MTEKHILPIDEMFIDKQLQAPSRYSPVGVVGENEPLNLLPIQDVITHQREKNFKITVGNHFLSPEKNDAEAP
jgi:hypothetical protein